MELKGWRTLLVNGGIVVATALLHFAAGINWSDYVSPATAIIIMAAVNTVMRLITTTPVGKSV